MSIFNNFTSNFKKGLEKFNFKGRSSRKEILQITVLTPLVIVAFLLLSFIVSAAIGHESVMLFGTFISIIALVCNAFASLFALGRRLQDLNVHGFFAIPLIFLSPIFYFISGLLLLLLPSGNHNKFGPNLDKININSEAVQNYIYYKYFSSNPIHQGMTVEKSNIHNKAYAEMYLKLISESDLREFEQLMATNIHKEIDFSESLPLLNGEIKYNELVTKHKLENFDYNKLFSELKKYAKDTQNQNISQIHNKEFNG